MYPFFRLAWQFFKIRNSPPMEPTDTHVSHHYCMPWDIDMWWELNNGRTLTLYDMGRIPLAKRAGLVTVLQKNRWGLTIAGVSVRYRQRIRMFEKIEMRSRAVGWDDKFIYLEQSMWKKNGDCAGHALYRTAVTGKQGIISPQSVIDATGRKIEAPVLADWIKAWIAADAQRPWPPMQDSA